MIIIRYRNLQSVCLCEPTVLALASDVFSVKQSSVPSLVDNNNVILSGFADHIKGQWKIHETSESSNE